MVRIAYLIVAIFYFLISKLVRGGVTRIVLCYHSVRPEQAIRFERQMRYIAGLSSSLDDCVNHINPQHAVSVTFDDAFEGLLDTAVPITKHLGIPISIFAVSGNFGCPPMWAMDGYRADSAERLMSAEQLVALSKEPHCLIGSHTVTHRRLAELGDDEIYNELLVSRKDIEQLLGRDVGYLALPHGSCNATVIKTATKLGYKKILTLDEISNPGKWPDGTIGRFSVSPDMWMIEFALTVLGGYSWLYSWRVFLRGIRKKWAGSSHGR